MADLLECVIQIKALADSPRRLALRLGEARFRPGFDASVPLRQLLAYEEWFHLAVASVLSGVEGQPVAAEPSGGGVPPGSDAGSSESLLARFTSMRADIVRRLDACTAEELSRKANVRGRGATTVADLVALALSHDTDTMASVVRQRGFRPYS